MIQNEKNLEENSILLFLIHPQAEGRGQVQFCQKLFVDLFEKGDSPCTKEFPDVKIKRQLFDHYLKDICKIKSQYGTYTKEISTPNSFHGRYLIQTDDVDIEFYVFCKFLQNT